MNEKIFKKCSKCKRRKPIDEFYISQKYKSRIIPNKVTYTYRSDCKKCVLKFKRGKKYKRKPVPREIKRFYENKFRWYSRVKFKCKSQFGKTYNQMTIKELKLLIVKRLVNLSYKDSERIDLHKYFQLTKSSKSKTELKQIVKEIFNVEVTFWKPRLSGTRRRLGC